ncbi:hypothetical protein SAMN05421755_101541 [Nitrosomonas sp. Nm33]|nr:hypothetical protein SAMN05421755_101541 [Nitrosomonas sp. Nm33]
MTHVLAESQLQALEIAKVKRQAESKIETQHPGYLGTQVAYSRQPLPNFILKKMH